MALRFWSSAQRNPDRVAAFYSARVLAFHQESQNALRAVITGNRGIAEDISKVSEAEQALRESFRHRWNVEAPLPTPTFTNMSLAPDAVAEHCIRLAGKLRSRFAPLTANGKMKVRRREENQVLGPLSAAVNVQAALMYRLTTALTAAFPIGRNTIRQRQAELEKVKLPAGVRDAWTNLARAKPGVGPLVLQVGTVCYSPVLTAVDIPTGACSHLGRTTNVAVDQPLLVPALVDFDKDGGFVTNEPLTVVSAVLRMLALLPAGELKLHIFDPLQLGSSIRHLNDLADRTRAAVTGSRIYTTQKEFEALLDSLTRHIADVTQRYLGSRHRSLRSYNELAGETAEAYRLLVVLDYPTGIQAPSGSVDASVLARLETIIKTGPRCGLYTIVLASHKRQSSYSNTWQDAVPDVPAGLPVLLTGPIHVAPPAFWPSLTLKATAALPNSLPVVSQRFEEARDAVALARYDAYAAISPSLQWSPTTASIDDTVAGQLVRRLDADVVRAPGVSVDPARVSSLARASQGPTSTGAAAVADPRNTATWWRREGTDGIRVTIGRKGDRGVAELFLQSSEPATLIGGRPGSGKSVLLHAIICDIARNYAPTDVQLYLLDPKQGVEFNVYAKARLPHTAVVTVSSAPDCTIAILETLLSKMESRGKLFRKAGVQKIEHYRPVNRANPMPRIVVVVDEFQKLLDTGDDTTSSRAADVINRIIREGRAFGIHLILATQSLFGVTNLPAAIGMISTRVALQMSDDDSRRILGDTHNDAANLSRTGQAILQLTGELFTIQVTHEADASIDSTVRGARTLSTKAGLRLAGPKVIDFSTPTIPGGAVARDLKAVRQGDNFVFPLSVHYGLEPAQRVVFAQAADQNLMIVTSKSQDVDGSRAVALMGMVLAGCLRSLIPFDVIDFSPPRTAFSDALADIRSSAHFRAMHRFHRQLDANSALHALARLVVDRRTKPGVHSAHFAILGHLHTATDVSLARGGRTHDLVTKIIGNGPAVGVYVIASFDSYRSVDNTIGSHLLSAFGHKMVGKTTSDDALALTGDYMTSKLDPDELAYIDPAGEAVRTRAFAQLPSTFWARM